MHLKSKLFAALASVAWFAAPALSQEPPTESPPTSPDLSEPAQSPSASQDIDQGAPTQAQDPSATSRSPSAPATADANALDDQKLDQFANAYMEVQTIQQKASAELQSTTDPAAADKVKTTAETDMIAAVERSGLQVEEFNQIVESMASNVEVRNRVAAKLQERSGG
jgi:hypothetical protein